MTTISMELYKTAVNNYEGWCTVCQEFTRFTTEPDAQDYDCPKCGGNTVVGAENAMISEMFDIG